MVNTRFWFELDIEAGGSSRVFSKNIAMPYRIPNGEDVAMRNDEGAEYDFTVKNTYFDLSKVELVASLGYTTERPEDFEEAVAFFIADGWDMQQY